MSFFQKEIIVTTQKQKQNEKEIGNFSDTLLLVHKYGYIAACVLYTFSTIFALPCFSSQDSSQLLSKQLLFNFAILLAISQCCHFVTKMPTVSKFEFLTFLITLIACVFFGVTTVLQEKYNQGTRYMVSSFLLSVSNEFKIIKLLLPKNRFKQERNRFLSELICCCSSIIFFFVAVLRETSLQTAYTAVLCPSMNFISGVLMSLSILYVWKAKEDKQIEGYQGLSNLFQTQ